MKPKAVPDVEERVIPSEKRENILAELIQFLLKWNTVKYLILVIQLQFSCVKNCGKKLIKIKDLSDGQYSVNQNIRFKNPMLRLDLRNYKDAYTVVKEMITVTDTNNDSRQNKKLIFKNNATFISCTEKIITHLLTMAIILLHQEVCGIIRATKWMMMWMKMMLLVIIG